MALPRHHLFVTGSFSSDAGFISALSGALAQVTSNGVAAWNLVTTVAAGDLVFHSVGDRSLAGGAGDTDIWVRMQDSVGAALVITYQDWMTAVANGDISLTTNNAGVRPSNSSPSTFNFTGGGTVNYYIVVSPYELVMYAYGVINGGGFNLYFGRPNRLVAPGFDGIARLATATTSSSGMGPITLAVDRNLTGQASGTLTQEQYVWMMPVTQVGASPHSASLSGSIDIVRVTRLGASTIDVVGTTRTYPVGSLVGVDPAAVCVGTALNGSLFFNQLPNGSSGSIGTNQNFITDVGSGLWSSLDADPVNSEKMRPITGLLNVSVDGGGQGPYRGLFGVVASTPNIASSPLNPQISYVSSSSDGYLLAFSTSFGGNAVGAPALGPINLSGTVALGAYRLDAGLGFSRPGSGNPGGQTHLTGPVVRQAFLHAPTFATGSSLDLVSPANDRPVLLMRARDSGRSPGSAPLYDWVYWTSVGLPINTAPGITDPSTLGALSSVQIVRRLDDPDEL